MRTPSAAEIAKRFITFAPQRSARFEEGVRNPGQDWAGNTSAAEPNYNSGVTKAISRSAFGRGVKKCGTARQQAKTILNLPRWVEGISNAGPEMESSMGNVVKVLETTTLPPYYGNGDPRNYLRVQTVGTALRKAKEEGRI